MRAGHVLEEVTDIGVTGTRAGEPVFIDRVTAAPPGQVWFADGRNDLWGLPATSLATTRFVPERGRDEQLSRSAIPFRLPGRRRLYLEEELSPAVDNALIAVVAQGVVVRARYRGLLRSQNNHLGGRREHSPSLSFIRGLSTAGWSLQFARRSDEYVTAELSTDLDRGLRLSHIVIETENYGTDTRTRRRLDLSNLSDQPHDLSELVRWLLSAEPEDDRASTAVSGTGRSTATTGLEGSPRGPKSGAPVATLTTANGDAPD